MRYQSARCSANPMTLRMIGLSIALLIFGFSALAAVPVGGPQSRYTVPHVDAQILVKPAPGVLPTAITDLLVPFGGLIEDYSATADLYVVSITDDADLEAAITALELDSRFEFAQPNYIFEALATPNDLNFAQQWSKDNVGFNAPNGLGTPGADMNMIAAWDIRQTAPGVIIAIIDDSVETQHSDLVDNIMASGKCFASPTSPRPCTNGPNDPNPVDGNDFHGTLVAGSAAARGNNSIGIAGVAWETNILPIKVDLTSYAIANAIDEAIAQNADIANMSFGGPVQGAAQQEALNRAETAGMLVVAAAGNADANNDIALNYPSDSVNQNVVAVAATTSQDNIASFSQWAPFSVDIAAPGELVITTAINNSYASASGTSFAAPHIAGIAALIAAETGASDYQEVKAHLLFGGINGVSTLGPVVPGQNKGDVPGRAATGRIDAERALTGPTGGVVLVRGLTINDAASGNNNGVIEPGETVQLEITLENAWLGETAVTGILSTPDAGLLSVNDTNPVLFGSIGQNGTATASFSVTLASNVVGNEQIFLQLDLGSANSPVLPSRYFYLETGSLMNGVIVSQQIQRWDWDEFHSYDVAIPVGATDLTITTSGPGDIDLLVRHGQKPEYLISLGGGFFYYVDSESQVSGTSGADESISIANPLPGVYHVAVVNYDQTAKTYNISASYSAPSSGDIAFSADTYTVNEDAGAATITVTRSGGVGAATVNYSSAAGSATPGADYTDVVGTLTWLVGENGDKSFAVPINNDPVEEALETVVLNLSSPTGATLGSPASATLDIVDDDNVGGVFVFTQSQFAVAEGGGTATIGVSRNAGDQGAASVDFNTQAATASPGTDYTESNGTLNWQDGESGVKTFQITVVNDSAQEATESVAIQLSNAVGAVLGSPSSASLDIADDDATVTNSGGGGGGSTDLATLVFLLCLYCISCSARSGRQPRRIDSR